MMTQETNADMFNFALALMALAAAPLHQDNIVTPEV
jgi:hypothetical protein